MAKHSLVWDHIKNQVNPNIILRDDNVWIPADPANTDYQKYLKWIDEGNQPDMPKVQQPTQTEK